MKNKLTIRNNNNELMTIEILFNFKIEKINKEYVVYTINDDEKEEFSSVLISEIKYNGRVPELSPIKSDEKEMVLMFYEKIKNSF